MPDLSFAVESVSPVPFAAAPTLAFALKVANTPADQHVHSIVLRCQLQIEATRRRYDDEEQRRLSDIFGEPERWSQTLRTLLWTHAVTVVPRFTGETITDLHVPCTFDFNVAATKYFSALDDGDLPLCLQFSGTVFYEAAEAALQISQISWNKEARYRLPVSVWTEMMAAYYPNSAWLRLHRDTFDRLHAYKRSCGFTSWEQMLDSLVPAPSVPAPSFKVS